MKDTGFIIVASIAISALAYAWGVTHTMQEVLAGFFISVVAGLLLQFLLGYDDPD